MDLDAFRAGASAWLAANRAHAPRDYGAILPAALRDEGVAWQRRLFDAGYAGLHWPVEHGGRGLTPEHTAAWITEAAIAQVPPFLNMVGIVLAGGSILRFGTPDQQAEHLRPTITGERVWCQLFSEPGAGSDLGSLTTSATRDGDDYVVKGQKVWCSNGRISDWGILMARTDPALAKHQGISFFLLDMRLAGIDVQPLRQMTGESEFDEVFLDEVRVPAHCLLGPRNGGWHVGMATLTNERGHIGASAVSLQRRIDAMAALARDDAGAGHAGDRSAGAVERDRVAALVAKGRAYQALGRRQGPVASAAASLMKLGITELLVEAAMIRAGIAGAGAMLDGEVARGVVAAPAGRIAGGTTQVQKNIIGERVLGLPREPR